MQLRICSFALLAACGGGNSSTPDAPPDMFVELDAPMDGLMTHRFVVASMNVPTNNNQAREFGLDLNNDATVDNQLGMVLGTLAGQGLDTQTSVTSSIDRGTILLLPELRTDMLGQSTLPATFTMFKGADPNPPPCASAGDTTCRKHLAGTASFRVAPDSAHDAPLIGAIVGGVFTGGPGRLQLITNMLGPTPIAFDLIGARVKLTMLADGTIGSGIVAGGVKQTDLDAKVYPQLQMSSMAAVAKDCPPPNTPPGCGCAAGTTVKTFLDLFDTTPKNCAITVEEIKNNSLIQSLFAPDVTIDGQQAISIGVKISGTRAKFTN
jgi:hypothetical protein